MHQLTGGPGAAGGGAATTAAPTTAAPTSAPGNAPGAGSGSAAAEDDGGAGRHSPLPEQAPAPEVPGQLCSQRSPCRPGAQWHVPPTHAPPGPQPPSHSCRPQSGPPQPGWHSHSNSRQVPWPEQGRAKPSHTPLAHRVQLSGCAVGQVVRWQYAPV